MKSMKGLGRKLHRLEGIAGINKLPELPVCDCLHIIQGVMDQEIVEKRERIESEMTQKYGPLVLRKLSFMIVRLSRNERVEAT